MSNLSFSTGFRDAILDGGLDGLFDAGFLDIYSGAQPVDANAAEGAGTLLASIEVDATAFAAASGGARALNGTWEEAAAIAGGTAAWFRLYASAHTTGASTSAVRIDGDVSLAGGGGDLILSSVIIVILDAIVADAFNIVIPLAP